MQKLIKQRESSAMCTPVTTWGDTDNGFVFEREPSYWKKVDTMIFALKKEFREVTLPAHMGGPIRPYVESLDRDM